MSEATFDIDVLSGHEDLKRYEQRKADLEIQIADASEGASVPNWQRALKLYNAGSQKGKQAADAMRELGLLLEQGARREELEARLDELTKLACRIRKDENKRLADIEGRVTPQELRKVVHTNNDIVFKKLNETGRALGIGDEQLRLVRKSISEEIRRSTRSGTSGQVG